MKSNFSTNGWLQRIFIAIPWAASHNSKWDGGVNRLEFQEQGGLLFIGLEFCRHRVFFQVWNSSSGIQFPNWVLQGAFQISWKEKAEIPEEVWIIMEIQGTGWGAVNKLEYQGQQGFKNFESSEGKGALHKDATRCRVWIFSGITKLECAWLTKILL